MIPERKGKASRQAHVDLPEGTYEEEHGRQAFTGPRRRPPG
jgi:homogentisate 1,2-dioxygenase